MTPGERLKQVRERRGVPSAKEAAEAMGVPVATYIQHENGVRGVRPERAQQYAIFYGVSPEWIVYGKGDDAADKAGATVPLVGYVGAGAEAHFYASADDGLGEVEAPPEATTDTRAAEIRGESLGPLFEGWLVFYDDVRTPVTPDLIGQLCVVGLPNDKVLVKKLRLSRTPGLYHLLSNSEAPMLDQEVAWAAKVKTMRPR
ncbi:XRE family transcriptional regulator [Phenylobacterium immobile]|uniref:XRE family transcriptional regulator n=1 Tax=Phenylobacterium immobile TaxID=21 RepID=UPI000AD7F1DB|nr:helix-turn-helix transcriptional regulator [Phenylobacterium immobile]